MKMGALRSLAGSHSRAPPSRVSGYALTHTPGSSGRVHVKPVKIRLIMRMLMARDQLGGRGTAALATLQLFGRPSDASATR
jgi:hypothetical protein